MGQDASAEKYKNQYRKGAFFAILAMVIWGVLPIYWQALRPINSYVIILYRIVLVGVVSFLVTLRSGGMKEIREVFRYKKTVLKLFAAGMTVTLNWSIYIWAVNADHVIQTCIGYYIEPLMICVFGIVLFREKLTNYKKTALAMALLGVVILLFHYGELPVIALGLALTFATYTALKKDLQLPATVSLFFETVFIVPVALAIIIYLEVTGHGALGVGGAGKYALLMLAGFFTGIPLALFAEATNRVPMTTIGMIEYVSPSITLIIGLFIMKEPFDMIQFAAFVVIWIGLIFFTYGEIKNSEDKLAERKKEDLKQ